MVWYIVYDFVEGKYRKFLLKRKEEEGKDVVRGEKEETAHMGGLL